MRIGDTRRPCTPPGRIIGRCLPPSQPSPGSPWQPASSPDPPNSATLCNPSTCYSPPPPLSTYEAFTPIHTQFCNLLALLDSLQPPPSPNIQGVHPHTSHKHQKQKKISVETRQLARGDGTVMHRRAHTRRWQPTPTHTLNADNIRNFMAPPLLHRPSRYIYR